MKGYPPRRSVVERTLAWRFKCRAILVRCHKEPSNYIDMVRLACALI